MLSKPYFDSLYDKVVLVDAPAELRLERALKRGGIARENLLRRMAIQSYDPSRADYIIMNDSSEAVLYERARSVFFERIS